MIPRCAILITGLLIGWGAATRAAAQSSWEARLDIDPYPSPYLSDWESNPTIATLTITNPSAADQDVLLVYRVTNHRGQVTASGRSDPQPIPRGPPTILTDFVDLSGTSEHDQGLEDQMRRTGRLPEGDHTACVTVTDQGGFVLAEDCVTFTIVYPDPPYLIGPQDDAMLTSGNPVFQWTPLQVPPSFQLTYVMRISEVLPGQAPAQSLVANIPLHETTSFGTNLEYPLGAPPLEEGKTYAWRVQVLDQNGYAASANEGRSEIWTFRLGDPSGGGPVGGGIAITLDVTNNYDDDTNGDGSDASGRGADSGDPSPSVCDAVTWSAQPNSQLDRLKLTLMLSSPVGFSLREVGPAQLFLYRAKSDSRQWAVLRNTGKHLLMAYGDCDGWVENAVPWVRWLGIRTVAGATSTDFLMDQDPTDENESTRGLEFGIVVFTLENVKVAAPDGFEIVDWFLEGNSFSAKPGVNTFGILQLEEGEYWRYFQALGFDDKELTLQGFVGMGTKVSVGFGVDSKKGAGAEASLEAEFLNLRGALPPRAPILPGMQWFIKSHLLEIELAVTAKVSGRTSGRSDEAHVQLMFRHKVALSDNLADQLRLKRGAQLVSTLGVDLGRTGHDPMELKIFRRYALEGGWALGETAFTLGNIQLEVSAVLSGKSFGDISFTLSGAAGWGNEKALGRVAITLTRSGQLAREPDVMRANVKRWQENLAYTQEELGNTDAQLAEATSDSERAPLQRLRDIQQNAIDDYHKWIEEDLKRIVLLEQGNASREAQQLRESLVQAQPTCFKLKGWICGIRFSFGNISLVDLLVLFREIGFAVAS